VFANDYGVELLDISILEESKGCPCPCPCPRNPLTPPSPIQPMVLESYVLSKNITTS
jgi:hypothetical protein